MSERVDLVKAAKVPLTDLEVFTIDAWGVDEDVLRLLNLGFRYSDGEQTSGDFLRQMEKGLGNLFVGLRNDELVAVMATEFVQYARKKTLRIVALAGTIRPFEPMLEFVESWAKANGAVELEAACRESMARMVRHYGFKEVYRLVRKPIGGVVQ